MSAYQQDVEKKHAEGRYGLLIVVAAPYATSHAAALLGVLQDQAFRDFVVRDVLVPGARHVAFIEDPVAFSLLARKDPSLLTRLVWFMESKQAGLSLLSFNGADGTRLVGACVNRAHVVEAPDAPHSESRSLALFRHLLDIEPHGVFQLVLGDLPEIQGKYQVPSRTGARGLPPVEHTRRPLGGGHRVADQQRMRAEADVLPLFPFAIFTCDSNEFYGHGSILREYADWGGGDPIRGLLQHGWQPGTGLRNDEILQADCPGYTWSRRCATLAREMGQDNIYAIGAPLLYMPPPAVASPLYTPSVLAIPHHSINYHRITESWEPYAEELDRYATDLGAASRMVCLYHVDYAREEVRRAFESRGFATVTCGDCYNKGFLFLLRRLILSHTHVTSNRLSTAAFYALHLERNFELVGPPMSTDPPDQYEDLTGDREWIREHYPRLDTVTADVELGLDCKWSRYELRHLLYGWLDGRTESECPLSA